MDEISTFFNQGYISKHVLWNWNMHLKAMYANGMHCGHFWCTFLHSNAERLIHVWGKKCLPITVLQETVPCPKLNIFKVKVLHESQWICSCWNSCEVFRSWYSFHELESWSCGLWICLSRVYRLGERAEGTVALPSGIRNLLTTVKADQYAEEQSWN